MSGRFTGTLHAQGSGQTRDVAITLDKTSVTEVRTREEFDRKGYADVIRQHLYSLEFDAQDREYWRAPAAPTPITPPAAGAPSPREHD